MSQFSEPNTSEHGLDPGKISKYSFQYMLKKESVGMLPSLTLKEGSEGREHKGTGMKQISQPPWLGCLRQVWPIFLPSLALLVMVTPSPVTVCIPFHPRPSCGPPLWIGMRTESFSFPMCHMESLQYWQSHYFSKLDIRKNACTCELRLNCPNVRNAWGF